MCTSKAENTTIRHSVEFLNRFYPGEPVRKISNPLILVEKFVLHLFSPPTHRVRGGRRIGGGIFRTHSIQVDKNKVKLVDNQVDNVK